MLVDTLIGTRMQRKYPNGLLHAVATPLSFAIDAIISNIRLFLYACAYHFEYPGYRSVPQLR